MKNYVTLAMILLLTLSYGQGNDTILTQKLWRVNLLNPGIEFEVPTSKNSTLSTGLGLGYGGGYPDLTYSGSGLIYIISPFIDIQHKWFYNFKKRLSKNKNIKNNSGNFVSARLLIRGYSLAENVTRTSNFDFAIGPTWGLQRNFGKNVHLMFDIGPVYYFDTEGNGNIFPIYPQLNIGFNLTHKTK